MLSRDYFSNYFKQHDEKTLSANYIVEVDIVNIIKGSKFKVDDYSHFFSFFLRDQNSQHFNEDLVAVNASDFSFVLFFKAIDYTGASHCVISAN